VSKAFTSEETPDEPVLGRQVQRAARGQERPMTPEGYKALLAEQLRLQRGRTDPEKHKLALVNATLESVRVVTPPPRDGTVRFGSTVTLEWDDGRTQVVRLVGPDEAEGKNINVESPLARTLLEQREGDEVEVSRPRGVATARLVRVE
jgi:transcription elongation factor GreB